MITARKRRCDSNELAVMRDFKPTRIERELLARVFEVVTYGVHFPPMESNQEEAMVVGDRGDDARSRDVVEPNRVTLEQQERAA